MLVVFPVPGGPWNQNACNCESNPRKENIKKVIKYLLPPIYLERRSKIPLTAIIIFGTFPSVANTSSLLIVSSFPTTSCSFVGRYFSTLLMNRINLKPTCSSIFVTILVKSATSTLKPTKTVHRHYKANCYMMIPPKDWLNICFNVSPNKSCNVIYWRIFDFGRLACKQLIDLWAIMWNF